MDHEVEDDSMGDELLHNYSESDEQAESGDEQCALRSTLSLVMSGTSLPPNVPLPRSIIDPQLGADLIASASDIEWIDVTNYDPGPNSKIQIDNVNKGPELPPSFDGDSEPIDYFHLFFNDYIIDFICRETNIFAEQRKQSNNCPNSRLKKWESINDVDLKAYLGTILKMGLIPLRSTEEYFSVRWDRRIPFFRDVFSKDEFQNIFWNMHFDHSCDDKNRFLMAPIVEHINSVSKLYYKPGNSISVDEITSFKGKGSFKMYNLKNPLKCGVKIYVASDVKNGYIYDFIPYFGIESLIPNTTLLKTTKIVKQLMNSVVFRDNDIPRSGLHVFTDRYFTSDELASELLKMNCFVTGTVMPNRTGMKNLKIHTKNIKRGEIKAFRKKEILVHCWKDKRVITMMSTQNKGDESQMTQVPSKCSNQPPTPKPNIVLDYIKCMSEVDRSDHFIASYQFMRNTKKWFRKFFYWLFEIAVINAYVLYKETQICYQNKPLTHAEFREHLALSLVAAKVAQMKSNKKPGRQPQLCPDERLQGRHFMLRKAKSKRCVVCAKRGVRKETVYYCKTCTTNPMLHPDGCFEIFHTKNTFDE